jgi:dienelactone hydrolase
MTSAVRQRHGLQAFWGSCAVFTAQAAIVFIAFGLPAWAQSPAPPLATALGEQVVQVPKKVGLFSIDLHTTLFMPQGNGPFPVVVMNHGRAGGNSKLQPRYRPLPVARFFVERGYAVVVPMRQGFAGSGGVEVVGGCNIESNGIAQAEDVRVVLDWVVQQTWADRHRLLVMGQSHGGWITLAFGTLQFDGKPYAGVRGLVNVAGGLRQTDCPNWPQPLIAAAARYGQKAQLPSLWLYGANDSFFPPEVAGPMHDGYAAAAPAHAAAQRVAFGPFGTDAHYVLSDRAGGAVWYPQLQAFLQRVGLPHERASGALHPAARPNAPAPTDYAALSAVDAVPHLTSAGRDGYRAFLARPSPRAFALAHNGAWAWATATEDAPDAAVQRAVERCQTHARGAPCRLYAVNDDVVWTATPASAVAPAAAPAATPAATVSP